MKSNDASKSKGGGRGRKRAASDQPTRSKTPGDNTYGETPGTGAASPPRKKKSVPSSILHHIYRRRLGQSPHSNMREHIHEPFLDSMSFYHYRNSIGSFDRRVTCVEWNPAHHSAMAIATKSGDICLWDYLVPYDHFSFVGWGARDCVTDMKFNHLNPTQLFMSSMNGTMSLREFNRATDTATTVTVFANTGTEKCWFCCVDVSVSRQMLVTGDNVGRLRLVGLDGTEVFNNRLHKAKVTHAEFNARCDWLLATASVDHTVALWDLRNMKDHKSFLHKLPHKKAVNSVYFNPLDCSKLLTTDQYDEIRIYSSCDWSKPQHVIQHAHRQFQYLTPIKATWHPTYDIIVVGCYPEKQHGWPREQKTVDFFDSNTGKMANQLDMLSELGIKSINKFNPRGDAIASSMGTSVLVWDRDVTLDPEEEPWACWCGTGMKHWAMRIAMNCQGEEKDVVGPGPKLKKKLASLRSKERNSVNK